MIDDWRKGFGACVVVETDMKSGNGQQRIQTIRYWRFGVHGVEEVI